MFLRRTDRLIAFSVFGALAATWVVLLALEAFTALAGQLDNIGTGSYSLVSAVTFVAWTLPRRAYELFPTAAVIGALAGLGALAPTAEITAMRAGGMSKLRIALAATAAVGAMLLGVMILGETLATYGERQAQSLHSGAMSGEMIAAGRSGIWARDGDTLINARRGEAHENRVRLFDVRLYDFDPDGRLQRVSTAARAEHDGSGWMLHEVVRQTFDRESLVASRDAAIVWPSQLDPSLIALSIVDPRYMGFRDLSASIANADRNQLDASRYRSAFWRRVFFPLNTLAVVLIALPFAFGALRSGGMGKRLFLGVVLALGWMFFQRGVTNVAAVYELDFRLTQLIPATALLLAAAWYFRRHA